MKGIGITLFLIFMVLKLCGVIAWSWWWVSAPIWIPLTVSVVLLGGAAFFTAMAER